MRHPQERHSVGPIRYLAISLALLSSIGCSAQCGPFGSIQEKLDAVSGQLDALYVPFRVEIPGGLCNSAASPSANPRIVIDSDGVDVFNLSSALIKRGPQNPLFGEFAVEQAADIMGMPVRRGGSIDQPKPGGNVPHQIVAAGGGDEDVTVHLFCRSDEQDLEIETILVAGWRKPADTISVTYVPGG